MSIDKSDKSLIVSFSGGRTSAYMTWYLLNNNHFKYKNIHVVFANTGQEHPKTLEFVHNCDTHFGFNTTWIEAAVNHGKRKGTDFRIVDFETASRKGEPFEDVIKKYGIPNPSALHCTRELKEVPIRKFVRSLGLKNKTYDMAIGIRADEIDRMSESADQFGYVYPLVKLGMTKQDVINWWNLQPFNLEIPEHMGNCLWCYKKTFRKLMTVMDELPDAFDFPERMEREQGYAGALGKKRRANDEGPVKPYRGWLGVSDLRVMKQEGYEKFVDENFMDITSGGCSDSCEVFH